MVSWKEEGRKRFKITIYGGQFTIQMRFLAGEYVWSTFLDAMIEHAAVVKLKSRSMSQPGITPPGRGTPKR